MKFLILIIMFSLLSCGDLGHKRKGGDDPDPDGTKKEGAIDDMTWFHKSLFEDGAILGASIDLVYEKLKVKQPKNDVIVAVLSDGFQLDHPDLEGKIWTNSGENEKKDGVDDDKNGYIDDIHGWNYLANSDATDNLRFDNLEIARTYKIDCIDEGLEQSKSCKDRYKIINAKKDTADTDFTNISGKGESFKKLCVALHNSVGQADFSIKALEKLKSEDNDKVTPEVLASIKGILDIYAEYPDVDFIDIDRVVTFASYASRYHYVAETDWRTDMIGNDEIKGYGNGLDLRGDGNDGYTGTHIASIIAGIRKKKGTRGISNNVKIMPLKVATYGDPRDRDVAHAIRYATDNGASIIVIGFEKEFSSDIELVDKEIAYAISKDVIVVMPAGDRGSLIVKENPNVDTTKERETTSFPRCLAGVIGCIKIGASAKVDKRGISNLVYKNSNYSPEFVNMFAPGDQIFGAIPTNSKLPPRYTSTVQAAAVVAGILALGKGQLDGFMSIEVFLGRLNFSSNKFTNENDKMIVPGLIGVSTDSISRHFSEFSATGGLVDAFSFIKAL